MSPKLLQKTSNRFLQQSLPENLIPNKRLGKRERFRSRQGAAYNNHSRMEREFCRQWVFSWNTLKKRMQQQEKKNIWTKSIELCASLPVREWSVSDCAHPRFLVAPSLYMVSEKISRAVGGNIIEHLNQYIRGTPLLQSNQSVQRSPAALPLALRAEQGGEASKDHPFSSLLGGEVGGKEEKGFPQGATRDESLLCTPSKEISTHKYLARGVTRNSTEWKIRPTPYRFPEDRERYFTAADFLAQQIQSKFYHMIYSLHEKGKAGGRRDRINDDYRNQLAECRKIAFLYGDLPRKTLVRAMRRAKAGAGDVDSNFLSSLETRLDVVLKRAFFFSTIKAARQWVERGKILVNNQPITVSSYLLQPGDFIRISPHGKGGRSQWKKQCLRMGALALGKGVPVAKQPRPPQRFNREINRGNALRSRPPFSPPWDSNNHQSPGKQYSSEFPGNLMKKQRRFPFSPLLMRKWKIWSEFWSNSRHPISTASPGHKWTGAKGVNQTPSRDSSETSTQFPHHLLFSSSSAFAPYLAARGGAPEFLRMHSACLATRAAFLKRKQEIPMKSLEKEELNSSLLLRRETAITGWLNGDRRASAIQPHRGGGAFPGHGRIDPAAHAKQPRYDSFTGGAFSEKGVSLDKKKTIQYIHQQQSFVVDGLYSLRWNAALANRPSSREKAARWRWSCIKPLHLECSYKGYTVIFLYSPQKLGWPSSVNVFLLRKALGG